MEMEVVGRENTLWKDVLMDKCGDRVKDLMEEGLSVWLRYAST